jgi:hypothetical protein
MKFFFADSFDVVDPSFDFELESRSSERIRHRSDTYAHQLFTTPAYDGLLVSKGIVDTGRYSLAQRHRLLRIGAKEFLRTRVAGWGELPVMGDCGAFTYVREEKPPVTVDDVLRFYTDCDFDFGISVDHVILAYQPAWDDSASGPPAAIRERQELTLTLAAEFLAKHRSGGLRFVPLGVAQGWSAQSYRQAVRALQDIGYRYIALGGMVGLKTREILECLEAIQEVRRSETDLHLLGVTRLEQLGHFRRYGVVSFDSTSPLRQAFKDADDNYYTLDRNYTAIRVPQVEGNPRFQKLILAGKIPQERARALEQACLVALRRFDAKELSLDDTLEVICSYEKLHDPAHDHHQAYGDILANRPWSSCECDICKEIGFHVAVFRGAERNRRRGFHNLWVFYRRLQLEQAESGGGADGTIG